MIRRHLLAEPRTKTVATIGPACATQDQLVELIECGVDLFRLNMAHGKRADHDAALKNIRAASQQTERPIGILVDLAGPKIRLGKLLQEPLELRTGQTVKFVRGREPTVPNELTSLYPALIDEVAVGDTIILGDGMARLQVTHKATDEITCGVTEGGEIRSRQGINLPGTDLSVPALGPIDIDNAVWASQNGVDYISLSFVRNADEVKQLKKIIADQNGTAHVVAKIEKREALDQLDAIVEEADAVMVARGDLGVEIDIEKTPAAQKQIIATCLRYRKPVIVATQMLESMHTSSQPTRAEVTDVANAILDGADACMLSGETAIGAYPAEAVTMMNKIMAETEKSFARRPSLLVTRNANRPWPISDAVIYGSAQIANRIDAAMVVIASDDCGAARTKSKQRDYIPTVCITHDSVTLRKMCLYWGITPVCSGEPLHETPLELFVSRWALERGGLQVGDTYVVVTDTEVLPGIHDSVLVAVVKAFEGQDGLSTLTVG